MESSGVQWSPVESIWNTGGQERPPYSRSSSHSNLIESSRVTKVQFSSVHPPFCPNRELNRLGFARTEPELN